MTSTGRDPVTGGNRYPDLEFARLAIPRRVYARNHMDLVADTVINPYRHREHISSGLT